MATLFLQASGPAPVTESWRRYAEPDRWPAWAPQVVGVRVDGGDTRIHPGMTGEVRSFLPPAAGFVVTAVDELARTWSWRVTLGPLHLTLDHGVEPCLDGGTSTWLRLRGPLPVLLAYAPLARAALRRLVHADQARRL